jgi:toxin ParE1/3/4
VRVEWLPAAERNRESDLAYIAKRNPWAAIDMGDAIEAAVRHLVDNPHIGRLRRVKGTRELVVNGTPYVIAYRVEPRRRGDPATATWRTEVAEQALSVNHPRHGVVSVKWWKMVGFHIERIGH